MCIKPCIIWITGLSGSGKTTIADALFKTIKTNHSKCIMLDGDQMRKIFSDTGFDKESRIKYNITIGYMAAFLEKKGYIVIVSLISPFSQARDKCRSISNNFIETYIYTPLHICENRDIKGLYRKARLGHVKEFTGISQSYEPPLNAEIKIDTTFKTTQQCVYIILSYIYKNNHKSKIMKFFNWLLGSVRANVQKKVTSVSEGTDFLDVAKSTNRKDEVKGAAVSSFISSWLWDNFFLSLILWVALCFFLGWLTSPFR